MGTQILACGCCEPVSEDCIAAFCKCSFNCLMIFAGAPIVFSLPHFLDGDPDLRNRVIGMNPIREEHQSVIDIEPVCCWCMPWFEHENTKWHLTKGSSVVFLRPRVLPPPSLLLPFSSSAHRLVAPQRVESSLHAFIDDKNRWCKITRISSVCVLRQGSVYTLWHKKRAWSSQVL